MYTLRNRGYMGILALESSCDDSAVAYYCLNKGLLGHLVASQEHSQYGGVMPEEAARDHQKSMLGLVKKLLAKVGKQSSDISGIAYTAGPGLIGSLLIGASVARSLALAWQKPCWPIHHLEGHILAPFLSEKQVDFPFLSLLVSGGHTLFIWAQSLGHYEIIGQSLDDAAGEAFDKVARLLGLGFPGGPAIAQLAMHASPDFDLPRPLCHKKTADMSFSGLKTAVYQLVSRSEKKDYPGIAASFQEAVVDTLYQKTQYAIQVTSAKKLIVGGGVAANLSLRARLATLPVECIYPNIEFCTDNAAMIAYAAYVRLQADQLSSTPIVTARWPLDSLS